MFTDGNFCFIYLKVVDAVEKEVRKVFIDVVSPNLGWLNVDGRGKDMTTLHFQLKSVKLEVNFWQMDHY